MKEESGEKFMVDLVLVPSLLEMARRRYNENLFSKILALDSKSTRLSADEKFEITLESGELVDLFASVAGDLFEKTEILLRDLHGATSHRRL